MSHLRNFFAVTAALAVAAVVTSPTIAQDGFLSDVNAAQAGLKVAWSTQVKISSKAEIVDWQLVVDENKSTTYFVISYGKRKEVISEKDMSPFGVPYGIELARKAAEDRKEIIEYRLANDGKEDVEVVISDYTRPKSTLFALGASGQVISLDADTGATRWTQKVGDYRLPSIGWAPVKITLPYAMDRKFTVLNLKPDAFSGVVNAKMESILRRRVLKITFTFHCSAVGCRLSRSQRKVSVALILSPKADQEPVP